MDDADNISTKYTAEELKQLAIDAPLQWASIFLERNGVSDYDADEFDGLESMAGLDMILVDETGGHEGGGEHADRVFAIAPEDSKKANGRVEGALAYLRATGYYASNVGTTWDETMEVVEPHDVTVVQYHRKRI